jgi:hypothetical protein
VSNEVWTILNPGESYTFSPAVPLIGAFGGDPHSASGTFGGFARCDNTMVAISARIDWTSSERVHVLYGIVRECYEDTPPCSTTCSGGFFPPNDLYLTISEMSVTGVSYGYGDPVSFNAQYAFINQTYVLSRGKNLCNAWFGTARGGECDPPFAPGVFINVFANDSFGRGTVGVGLGRGNDCLGSTTFRLDFSGGAFPICLPSWSRSGTSTDISTNNPPAGGLSTFVGSFRWSITS